jgi:hypothetical protein
MRLGRKKQHKIKRLYDRFSQFSAIVVGLGGMVLYFVVLLAAGGFAAYYMFVKSHEWWDFSGIAQYGVSALAAILVPVVLHGYFFLKISGDRSPE